MMYTVERYHDFSAGHKVTGHESKCAKLHGHNYRITFTASAGDNLDELGRVIDFSQLKRICDWLEHHWDHRFLMWEEDPGVPIFDRYYFDSLVLVPFNPTAENMAGYLCLVIAPALFDASGITIIKVKVEETRKCSATFSL